MNNEDFLEFAKEEIVEIENLLKPENEEITKEDIITKWSSSTLKESKYAMTTYLQDYYYEFTINNDSKKAYMDIYELQDSYFCETLIQGNSDLNYANIYKKLERFVYNIGDMR